jgi:PAS domain S-box-containing protein
MEQINKTNEELQKELQALQQEFTLFKKLHENDATVSKTNDFPIEGLYKAIDQSPILTFIVNLNGNIEYINPKVVELTGYSSEELLGKKMSIFKSGKTTNEEYKTIYKTLKEVGFWKGEFINKKKNGDLYFIQNNISTIKDSNGNITHYLAIQEDINERKSLEKKINDINKDLEKSVIEITEKLYENNVFIGKIANNVPGVIFQYKLRPDGTSCFPYSSIGIKDIYRVNPEDLITDASSVFSAIHPDDFNGVVESIRISAKTLTLWNYKYRVKFDDGTINWLHGNSMPQMEADGSFLWHGYIKNITESKKIEEELVWNQSLLKLMANSSPLGFLVVDNRNDEILYSNNRFCEIWGIEHLAEKIKKGELKNNDIIPDCLPVLVDIPAFAESCKPMQDENNRRVITDEIAFTNNRTIQRFSTQIRGENDEYFGRFYIFEDITEQKRMVNELAMERTRLAEIIKGTNVGTWEWNIQTGETVFNERWAEIIGYSLAELSPVSIETWSKFVHPDDAVESGELLQKHFNGEIEYYTYEARMKHKNGQWLWVLDVGKVHTWDKDGKPLHMSGTHLDITENKRILEDLKESQETHRALNEAAFDSIFFSEKGICIQQNETGRKVFGYTDEEALGRYGTEWIVPEDRDLVMQNMLTGYQEPYEVTALKKDGTTFPCILSGKMMEFKGRNVRVTSLRDISVQKQAEQALLESQVQFAKFMDYLPALVFIKDSESKMIYGNNAMDKALGASTWVNKSLFELFDRETAERIIADDKITREQDYIILEESFQNLDGKVHDYETQKFTIPIPGKEPLIGGISLDITERKQAEEKFSTAFQSNAMLMVITNLSTGKFVDINQKALEVTGFTREQVIGKSSIELGIFTDLLNREEIFELLKAQDEQTLFHKEITFESKLNGLMTCLLAAKKINLGNEMCLLISMIDITERKKTEAALYESEEKLRTIIETSPDGVVIASLDGKIQFITQTTAIMFGYDNIAYFKDRSIFEFIDNSSYEKANYFINELMGGKISGISEYLLISKNGSTFNGEVSANILKDKDNNSTGILFVLRDISERIKNEKELAESAFRMKLATQSGGVGIFDYDLVNGVLVYDEQMYKLHGLNKDEVKMTYSLWESLVHPKDMEMVIDQTNKAIEANSNLNTVFRVVWPDGSVRYLNSKAIIEYNEHGKPIHMLGTNRDITDQILAEAETNKARKAAEEANIAKSEFLSRMSHELRTPLNSILGFAQLMEMGEMTAKQKNGVEHILGSGKHLLGLINEVLDLSKIEAGHVINKVENVNILETIYVVVDALKPAILERNIKTEIIQPIVIPATIKSDKKLITQVLFNLLNNAIKYNNTDGIIKIETEIIGNNTNEAKKIKVSITDTGKGIAAENLQKLFNPFERINAAESAIEGTGLGLSVVKKLVAVLGGNVGVESEVGVGSTFWITLPFQMNDELQKGIIDNQNEQISEMKSELNAYEIDKISRANELKIANLELDYQQHEKADRASELIILKKEYSDTQLENEIKNKKGVVLYIEDNKDNIELIKQVIVLKRPNIEIICSLKGKETLELAIKHQPDLILLDLNLPDMHGSEIILNLQANKSTQNVPVVIISADATNLQIEKNMNLGAKKYLTKPLDLAVLIATIDEWIGKKTN